MAVLLTAASTAGADEVRYVTEDGVTYREEYRLVREPAAREELQRLEETVYHDHFTTEMKETTRTAYRQVTTYEWQPRWQGPWGIGQPMHLTYEWKPVTRWQPYPETVRVPVTQHQVIAESRVTEVPTRVLGFEDRLQLVSRTPVNPAEASAQGMPAYRPTTPAQTAGGTPAGSGNAARYGATLRQASSGASYR